MQALRFETDLDDFRGKTMTYAWYNKKGILADAFVCGKTFEWYYGNWIRFTPAPVQPLACWKPVALLPPGSPELRRASCSLLRLNC